MSSSNGTDFEATAADPIARTSRVNLGRAAVSALALGVVLLAVAVGASLRSLAMPLLERQLRAAATRIQRACLRAYPLESLAHGRRRHVSESNVAGWSRSRGGGVMRSAGGETWIARERVA